MVWSESVPDTSFGFRTRLRFIEASMKAAGLPLAPSTTVLDVGCGTGELLTIPLASRGLSVTGIDLDARSIERARALASPASFAVSSAEELGGTYDVTICSEVLEHLHDPGALLATLRRLTRRLCIVTVPNGYGSYEMMVRAQRLYGALPVGWLYRRTLKPLLGGLGADRDDVPPTDSLAEDSPHVQFFTWRRLHALFRGAGWRVAGRRGRTLLCGPWLSRVVERVDPDNRWNAGLAGALPWLAADWMFSLERADAA